MEKEFVPYELAWELKQLNFDETCFGYYHNLGSTQLVVSKRDLRADNNDGIEYCLAPLYQQAFRWFREKYNLKDKYGVFPHHTIMFNYIIGGGKEEEAELACLIKLIEIVKNK